MALVSGQGVQDVPTTPIVAARIEDGRRPGIVAYPELDNYSSASAPLMRVGVPCDGVASAHVHYPTYSVANFPKTPGTIGFVDGALKIRGATRPKGLAGRLEVYVPDSVGPIPQ